jgi:peptidoglycan hydrolase-like protein with peptidoglycan-binding domain
VIVSTIAVRLTFEAATVKRNAGAASGFREPEFRRVTKRRLCRAMSSAILSWPVVRRGARNHPVRTLQHLLRAHNQGVAVDGIFGARSEAAIRAFQASRGLAVDGVVGPQTWRALIVTVRDGSRGEAVRAVQEEFQFRNLSGDPSRGVQIDGIFGPQTEAAVRGFQEAVGLTVDGVVGPLTWRALVSGMLAG